MGNSSWDRRRSKVMILACCGESTTPKPTMINPPPLRMTWKRKLLRLLHITSSRTTTEPFIPHLKRHDLRLIPHLTRHDLRLIPHLELAVPNTYSDDLPSDHLPRDIILEILSRLPAEFIFKCQCVSRPLRVLTTTPFFNHMQLQRSTPVIVVQLYSDESDCEITNLYYMDKEFVRIEEKFGGSSLYKSPVTATYPCFLLSSYDGFLMFASFTGLPETFHMWNPVTRERIRMYETYMHVCGLYFNPATKDHEFLYYTRADFIQYYYNFGAYNLRTRLKREVGGFYYPPSRYRPPIIIKGTLYWMIDRSRYHELNEEFHPPFSHSIMSFNIENEEFGTLEPGGSKYSATEPRGISSKGMLSISQLHLSEMDGELCLCDFVTSNELLLSIFNHAAQCWSTRTIVILPEYPLPRLCYWPNKYAAEVVQIKDNELVVRQGNRVLLYNMISHACKISEIMGSMDEAIRVTVHTHKIDSFY